MIVRRPGLIDPCLPSKAARLILATCRDHLVHLPVFFPRFRMPTTFSSILLRTTSKASF